MQIIRGDAYNLLCDWVKNENLRKHMLCVEAVMRAYARKYGEDEEMWGTCGLLHDFDYERYPTYDAEKQTGHPYEGVKVLKEFDYPEEIITAILGHAIYSGVPRETKMAKVLFAVDELCGFVIACALMRPDRLQTLEAPSVKKKLKDKSFAAKVSRSDIQQGIVELGIAEDGHINFVIQALRNISKDLGF
jgi:putative nucleotidyltransferase with HDIG domain